MAKLIGSRIKKYRTSLNLSTEYVAKYLNIPAVVLEEIENNTLGTKDNFTLGISGTEVQKLSKLFGVSEFEFLYGKENIENLMFYSRIIQEDRAEISTLMEIPRKIKKKVLK